MSKKIIVVGGANGVGKSTFAYKYADDLGISYLGADKIAENLTVDSSQSKEIIAARKFYEELNKFQSLDKSLVVESTLSGKTLINYINSFKKSGYFVHIVYIFLTSPNECKNRVAIRVKKGGHNVKDEDIERRYYRSLNNFRYFYGLLSDQYQIFNNDDKRPIEVALMVNNNFVVLDEILYNKYLELSE